MAYIGRQPELAVLDKIGPFTGDGVTATFTLSRPPGNNESVFIVEGGVLQQPGVSFEISGFNLNFLDANGDPRAPANGVEIFGLYRGLDISRKSLGSAATRQVGSAASDVPTNADVVNQTSGTGSAELPVGTTAERDASPDTGYVRYNSSLNQFEGYDGSTWGSLGGGATGSSGDEVFVQNDQVVTADYTIPADKNAMTTGPIEVDDGVTVTVSDGARWVVL